MAKGSVEYVKNDPYVRQVITTTKGEKLYTPQMVGSTTDIKALDDGKYELTTKTATFPKGKKTVTILTEDELVAKYGDKTGKKLQVVA